MNHSLARSTLPALALGLALGAATTWAVLRSTTPTSTPPAALPPPDPVSLPAWSWRDTPTPPLLTANTAAAAIAAWHAHRGPSGASPDFPTRASTLRALVLRLPATAFPRLLDSLSRADDDSTRSLRRIAFTAWTTQDAPASTLWAASRSEDFARELAREAIDAWAARDPAAAATWASALPDAKLALQLAPRALGVLAEKNPERALALARSRDPEFRDAALGSILVTLSKKDPAGTLRAFAPELWKNGEGFHKLRTPLVAWAKQDPSAALAWLLAQPRDPESNDLAFWLSSLGDNSPAWRRTLADTIATAPGLAGRARALRDLFFTWGHQQPDEALAWLEKLPDTDLRLTLLERVSGSYYSDNPERSLPLALAMPEGANREQNLSRLLGAWAKLDSDAALAWIRQHEAEPGVSVASRVVHGRLLAELAREDPKAALAEYAALADPATRAAAIEPIAEAWGRGDPAAAFRWAVENHAAAGKRYVGSERELLYRWAQTEPEAALRWTEAWIAADPERAGFQGSAYLEALGGYWNDKAPRAATADLYSKIKDPALRATALANHVREWLAKDPAAARAWLVSTSALTAEQRAALQAPPAR